MPLLVYKFKIPHEQNSAGMENSMLYASDERAALTLQRSGFKSQQGTCRLIVKCYRSQGIST